ncbi:CBK1 kinase activator protein [Yarrowia sp. C11]|nr:CBK1 kinase activator protein [Yarrowia sp. E02]KAG5369750.1 CBK1 kinase activator protein [Yarrowia sp. C11]
MSFFNSFSRGFGRSSKKTKPQQSQPNQLQASASSVSVSSSSSLSSISRAAGYTNSNSSTMASSHNGGKVQQKPLFMCQPFVRQSLVTGNFKTIVQQPHYVDTNEWLALYAVEFFSLLNSFYDAISEFVTPQACPTMNAGPGVDYLWIDGSKKAVRLPAATYIDYTFSWISSKLEDKTIFPTKVGVPFPPHFSSILKNIFRQMFRVFAHVYHNHFDKFCHLGIQSHWNSLFTHFIGFVINFDLIDEKEREPLQPLIDSLEAQGMFL